MTGSSVSYTIRLETALRKDGDNWLAWCLPLDLMTPTESREKATESLRDAVHLWFESCIERNVLAEALEEVGFKRATSGEHVPDEANIARAAANHIRAFDERDYIEVSVPAYIAA